jgi:SAM-dependent methyltransferase
VTVETLYRRFYYSRPDFVDGTTQFHRLVAAHVPRGARILEIGAGPANQTTEYLSGIGPVAGLDVSEEVTGNRFLSEARTFDGGVFPFPSASFDACVSNWVLEHVPDPPAHLAEVKRVLRPGGKYLVRTSNVWHYVYAFSRWTPQRVHSTLANRLRGLPAEAHEPYPTYYRANSLRRLRRLQEEAGLGLIELRAIEPEPGYGRKLPLFFPMLCYERMVNRTALLMPFRSTVLACFSQA